MPWEITIYKGESPDTSCLGSRDEVVSQLSSALSSAELQNPPQVPDDVLASMPEALRQHVDRPKLEAEFEHPDFSISFYCSDTDPIDSLNAEVRGNGDPLAALKSLCQPSGWSVWDCAKQRAVDFSQSDSSGWAAFCVWRDQAMSQVRDQT